MRALLLIIGGLLLVTSLHAEPGEAAGCTSDDFAKAVTEAGAALRKLSADNTPRLQAKMSLLKAKRKWPDAGYEDRAYEELQDDRIASLDASANALLARIDTLGTVDTGAAPDCSKLEELQAVSLELQATVKTRTTYLISKIDQMLNDAPVAGLPKPKAADAKAGTKPEAKLADAKAPPKAEPADAKPRPNELKLAMKATEKPESKIAVTPLEPATKPAPAQPPSPSGWSTQTKAGDPGQIAVARPGLPPGFAPGEVEGYSIEEIKAASAGFFGQVSANLAAVIEHLFRHSGRPTGYILGTEGGGAFLAGVRYGKGTLYMRAGSSQKIYWHGPSLGADIGGAGSKTLFLIYKLSAPEDLYSNFTGIDGSAYFVG
ncbi:MAG TPA: EipA family protein, partial [Hyphomicrobiaceae bacterium]|nr:EipA family protein [Hyphomicrobiaceae bacterium]